MINLSRREFFESLMGVGVGTLLVSACQAGRPKDTSELVAWTDIEGDGWSRGNFVYSRQAELVGGGCPCEISIGYVQGRFLGVGDLANLEASRHYQGVVSQPRGDIFHSGTGYVDEATVEAMFNTEGLLVEGRIRVNRVVRQLDSCVGEEAGPIPLDPRRETLLVAKVDEASGEKSVFSYGRVVMWSNKPGSANIYVEPLGIHLVKNEDAK